MGPKTPTLLVALLMLHPACGSSDDGANAGFAPAAVPSFPQVPYRGGPRLTEPEIIPVFFASDPLRDDLSQFYQWLDQTDYLTAAVKEYGIGSATLKTPVILTTEAPKTVDDVDIATFLAAATGDKTLPPPGANSAFVLHYPASTVVTLGGAKGCEQFGGYHGRTSVPGGALQGMVAYSVVPRCSWDGEDLRLTTNFATHEIVETITDPMGALDPGWQLDDTPGSGTEAWAAIGGRELADLCENQMYHAIDAYWVQDIWSNEAAAAFLNPCQPGDADRAFFTVVTDATIVHAAPGEEVSIEAIATSNKPTADWELAVSLYPPPSDFDGAAKLSKTSVNNGDRVVVTVNVPPVPPMNAGRSVYRFTIDSLEADASGFYHPWPVMVVVP